MKVLLTTDPEIPVPPLLYGGIQRIVDSLCRTYTKRGFEVALVGHPESKTAVSHLYPLSGRRSQNVFDSVRNINCVTAAVRAFEPDVIHSFARLLYLTPLLPGRYPKIMSYQREPGRRAVQMGSWLAGDSLCFTGCSSYITSQGRRCTEPSSKPRWETIYNFIEPSSYTFVDHVPNEAPLVFLSRIERVKGTHTAIEIARASQSKLIIAGNRPSLPDAKQYWETQIEPALDGEQIRYIGAVDDRKKNELLGSAKALLLPIEWNEPFGIVFTEALACGTPIITSAGRGAAPEIVEHAKNGYLTSSVEDAVEKVAALSAISREHCRQTAEQRFSVEVVAEQYISLYREMIAMSTGS